MSLLSAQEKNLIQDINRISDYYGSDLVEVIPTLDRYLRYYQIAERQKFEISDAVRKFKADEPGAGIDNLISTIEIHTETDERALSIIDSDLFDMERVKELLMAITIYQVRREPERDQMRKELQQQYEAVH